ncbi:pantetheine-phosphate adenylyltransferase [Consotaella salsifontis]|uniref:Phosphopantetheine adenylyltransferase n=1 Tax=Consotaella salsifontis TaxID=1365950 RepID=A0A1T4LTR6_9HYPH|nr:pantetheine-phosphate adenylyltransferase [Consotaella salsifontis]SJZ58102.1 Phosphopantetheine adenylyltransferase [Consotaella salsifontis]
MARIGFYPGSFDPITLGHVDVVRQAARLFDEIVCGIGVHPGKKPLFSFEERADMVRGVLADVLGGGSVRVTVVAFDGLTVEAARQAGAAALIRGLRDGTDFDYEIQMAGMNGVMMPDLVTVMLPASPMVRPITATLVRQIAAMGGDVGPFVPPLVARALGEKFSGARAENSR